MAQTKTSTELRSLRTYGAIEIDGLMYLTGNNSIQHKFALKNRFKTYWCILWNQKSMFHVHANRESETYLLSTDGVKFKPYKEFPIASMEERTKLRDKIGLNQKNWA